MVEIIASLLTVALLAWVLWPLLTEPMHRAEESETASGDELQVLLRKKETVYNNIRDLRFEHQMGKLSDRDFQELETGYQLEAADTLRRIELLTAGSEFDAVIEREVRGRRGNGKIARMKARTCPNCKTTVKPEFQYCTACGTALSPLPCAHCGAPLQPGMNFCPSCGQQV